ncbi:MAG: response regulator [Desulfuromonadaceae bacterium]|nr:response regulator [Desulfuromonadaceae bacterium]MDD2847483.1 response regulator [Desulfuromonadaceae bacterium]MDD4131404.1 response regulator [Desulfuromonadaceae bacterium]
MAENSEPRRQLWILGTKPGSGREEVIKSYLEAGGYTCNVEQYDNLAGGRPLGVVLDISPFSEDGWGVLLKIKSSPATRDIPVLPVYLSELGKVGGVFPVAGFFTLPVDENYLQNRLAVYGLTEEAETWDLQSMVVSRNGEDKLARAVESLGFEVVKGYTGKEALALSSIHPVYMVFCSQMLPDMSAFELQERLRLCPYSSNTPLFVLLKDGVKEGERLAMSREIAHLVRKKQLSCEEFLGYLRRRE